MTLEGLPSELADALIENRWSDALAATDHLLTSDSSNSRLWFIHGVLLRLAWRMDEAIDAYTRSIELGYPGIGPYRELFQHLEKRGLIAEALSCWRLAESRGHSTMRFHSMALDAMLKDAATTSASLLDAHRAWTTRYGQRDREIPAFTATPFDGSRPLRVGYVCSFWEAPTIRFMILPVLKRHDPSRVAPYLYVNGTLRAGETWRELYEPHAAAIRETAGLTDRAFVELVRTDGIDVLIELNGHSAAPRYAAMAARCAPVQATYLNYTSTTAVPNIDYAIGDQWSPPRGSEPFFTEEIARLPGCFFCYDYRDDPRVPPVSEVPSLHRQHVTFAHFGANTKISPPLIGWWAQILDKVPGSILALRSFELSPVENRRSLERRFLEHGVDPSRLRLMGKGTRLEIVKNYDDADIALDTWPYCGGNTTAEAVWQGVPVITLQGDRFSGSYGASLLHGAGTPELIARTPEEYVDLAVRLARAPERLVHYRRNLRHMAIQHGLCNADLFTRQFEQTLIDLRMRAAAVTA